MRCNHKESVRIVGDFWVCKIPGCRNGPALPTMDIQAFWAAFRERQVDTAVMEILDIIEQMKGVDTD